MTDIEQKIQEITGLITLPEIYQKLRRLIDDEVADIDEFAEVIIIDPDLSTRVLRLVNSAYFGFPEPIDSITRAINLIGIDQLHDMVLSASAMASLDLPNDILPVKPFWHNSLYTGVVAQQMAHHAGLERSDRLFIAGLLHEIGLLVLCAKLPDHAREAIRVSVQSEQPLHEVQRQMLGCHYGDIGAMLLQQWNLPAELQLLLRFHPTPQQAPEQPLETALLHLAHAYAGHHAAAQAPPAEQLIAGPVRARIPLEQDKIDSSLQTARQVSVEIGRGLLA